MIIRNSLFILACTVGFSLAAQEQSEGSATEQNSSAEETSTETSSEEKSDASASEQADASETMTENETTCESGSAENKLIRKIRISYGDSEGNDCKVHYDKQVENPGAEKVLWSAQKDPNYCQQRATELIEKHQGWGWTCSNPDVMK